jgi:hypothetical protein
VKARGKLSLEEPENARAASVRELGGDKDFQLAQAINQLKGAAGAGQQQWLKTRTRKKKKTRRLHRPVKPGPSVSGRS